MLANLRKRISLFWLWIAFWAMVLMVGLYAVFLIMTKGLVVTNMSDGAPWGLWIILDLSSIALGAGAFSISAIAYIMGRKEYLPLARVAVFVGILGYSGALMALALDIGRPDRFWHGWVFWNIHSMLWEVTMCITLYFMVLSLEVFPMVADLPLIANRFKRINHFAHWIHRFAPVLAFVGLFLSMLHQSSLGATYGVVVGRTHLFRTTMPLLFIVSAVAGGMSFTIHLTLLVQWLKGKQLVPTKVLLDAGQIAGIILLVYLYMRFWDTTVGNYGYVPGRSEAYTSLSAGDFAVTFWGWELILGGLVAAVLLIRAKFRGSMTLLMIGSGLAAAGVVFNRIHTTLLAFAEPLSESPPLTDPLVTSYTPAWTEWAATFGVISILVLGFSLGMKFLPAFEGEDIPDEESVSVPTSPKIRPLPQQSKA